MMAPTRAKTEKMTGLDALAASGYVWNTSDEDMNENRVVREDDFERRVDFLKIISMCMLAPR